jgi:hypothetical protein
MTKGKEETNSVNIEELPGFHYRQLLGCMLYD